MPISGLGLIAFFEVSQFSQVTYLRLLRLSDWSFAP
jgi:hypothetical protein